MKMLVFPSHAFQCAYPRGRRASASKGVTGMLNRPIHSGPHPPSEQHSQSEASGNKRLATEPFCADDAQDNPGWPPTPDCTQAHQPTGGPQLRWRHSPSARSWSDEQLANLPPSQDRLLHGPPVAIAINSRRAVPLVSRSDCSKRCPTFRRTVGPRLLAKFPLNSRNFCVSRSSASIPPSPNMRLYVRWRTTLSTRPAGLRAAQPPIQWNVSHTKNTRRITPRLRHVIGCKMR